MLAELEPPERVAFFDLEPLPIASRELRARLDRGEDVRELVPPAVWELIERDGLYGRAGYTEPGLTSIEQARRIAALAQEKLARDVVILDMQPVCTYTDYFVVCTGNNPRQTKGIWDEVHARLKQDDGLLPALGRRRARGDVDRRRLPRRRPARLHARGARLLPARRPLGRRAPGDGRGGERLSAVVYLGHGPSEARATVDACCSS